MNQNKIIKNALSGLFVFGVSVCSHAQEYLHQELQGDAARQLAQDEVIAREKAALESGKTEGEYPQSVPSEPAPEGADKFNVFEFRVTGNTVLENEKIEEAVYPWLGETKSVADVEKAREALEKMYHKSGYLTVLVDIPEQDVNNGVVTLNVTEGKVDNLRVQGSRYYSLGRIKAGVPSLAKGSVPYFPDVQKELSGVNRTADKRVTPVLKAGKKFGTVDVDLKVEDNLPVHASIELNDRYSNLTERWRLAGMLRYDNLFQRDHSLTLQFQTTPQDTSQVQVFSGSYLYRFDDRNTLLSFYAVQSKSNVAAIGGINVLGNGNIFGARVIQPLPSLANYYHTLSFGVDYKNFEQDVKFGNDTASTPVSYMPISTQYNGTYQDASSVNQLGLGMSFGLRDVVGSDREFAAKRLGAQSNFFSFRPEISRTQTLPWGMQLWAKVDGQYSGTPMISNEQYAAGGVESVRGYLEVETLGDRAIHSSVELRSPVFRAGDWLQELRLIGFYDVASLRVINPTLSEQGQRVIAGTGVGFKMKAWQRWNASVALARVIHDGEVTEKGDINGHMRFWYEF